MQLIIVGTLNGQIGAASQIAIKRGAKVQQADTVEAGLDLLRRIGADLVMIDVVLDVGAFMTAIGAERINVPVVACGVSNDTQAAVRAARAGAREYVPLPPDPELIAAVLEAVTEAGVAIAVREGLHLLFGEAAAGAVDAGWVDPRVGVVFAGLRGPQVAA